MPGVLYPLSKIQLSACPLFANDIDNLDGSPVIPLRNLDSRFIGGGVYDLSIADIHGYVIDRSSVPVKNQIAGLHLVRTHSYSLRSLSA